MREDIRRAALRAAGAIAAVTITGCETRAAAPTAPVTTLPVAPVAPTVTVVPYPPPPQYAAPKLDCEAIVAGAFPAEDPYPGVAAPISAEVERCCVELLITRSSGAPHRWACCASIKNEERYNGGQGLACTPWGPPVPPRMRARAASV